MSTAKINISTFVIALTGGIAAGKTTVSDAFSALGTAVVDTDIIARKLVSPGSEGLLAIKDSFGVRVIQADGELNRKMLRDIIFSNTKKRLQLQSILHPLIHAESIRQLQSVITPIAILVVPLLVEGLQNGSSYKWVDRVLVVDVEREVQVQRLMARDSISDEKAELILSSQATRSQRLAIADDVIINDNSFNLNTKIAELYQKYIQFAHDKKILSYKGR